MMITVRISSMDYAIYAIIFSDNIVQSIHIGRISEFHNPFFWRNTFNDIAISRKKFDDGVTDGGVVYHDFEIASIDIANAVINSMRTVYKPIHTIYERGQ